VNSHIRRVADEYAAAGYLAIAPALFDRAEPGVELGYSQADIARGREIRGRIGWDDALKDVRAAMKAAEHAGKPGVIGYCWGGSLAWLAAIRLNPGCAVCYYGGAIADFKEERPTCPVMMHFGERDHSIPIGAVGDIREAQPEALVFVYTAGHGFNCEQRKDYDPQSAAVAKSRTLSFLDENLG
jgi:carboxymethylenebutenolidase